MLVYVAFKFDYFEPTLDALKLANFKLGYLRLTITESFISRFSDFIIIIFFPIGVLKQNECEQKVKTQPPEVKWEYKGE